MNIVVFAVVYITKPSINYREKERVHANPTMQCLMEIVLSVRRQDFWNTIS